MCNKVDGRKKNKLNSLVKQDAQQIHKLQKFVQNIQKK